MTKLEGQRGGETLYIPSVIVPEHPVAAASRALDEALEKFAAFLPLEATADWQDWPEQAGVRSVTPLPVRVGYRW